MKLLGALLFVGILHAAPPAACGTQFQYSCSAATVGGYTVITPMAATGQTEIQGFNSSNAVVFDQTVPLPPSGTAATDHSTQLLALQAAVLVAAQAGVAAAETLPACSPSVTAVCIAPNPGGSVVVTNSTTSTFVAQDTPVSQRIDQYSTTLQAILNGNQTVFQQTYAAAFNDPTVQAAVTSADAILTGANATPSAPVQTSSSTVSQGSQLSYTLTGDTTATGNTTVTTIDTFGPAVVPVGEDQTEDFVILSGQLDINVNTDFELFAARNAVTTDTFLTTSSYTISGTTAAPTTPAPASWMLTITGLGLTGLMIALRRLKESS